jgi:hypothetical protein
MLCTIYADCHWCWVLHVRAFELSVIMMNVVMLSVLAPDWTGYLDAKTVRKLDNKSQTIANNKQLTYYEKINVSVDFANFRCLSFLMKRKIIFFSFNNVSIFHLAVMLATKGPQN